MGSELGLGLGLCERESMVPKWVNKVARRFQVGVP